MFKRVEVKEDAVQSVGSGAVPSLTDPSDVHALQKKGQDYFKKKLKDYMMRRRKAKC